MESKAISRKLAKQLTDPRLRIKTFGKDRAARIANRLDEIDAAETLHDISHYPPARLHPLHGDMEGLFTVDVSANFRLIFAGFTASEVQTTSEVDVVKVVFIKVEDYH